MFSHETVICGRPRISPRTAEYRTGIARIISNDTVDLNQDRTELRSHNERGESKWELDSRNVPYGIFSATPKKRAK
jgi:hypothetical protein